MDDEIILGLPEENENKKIIIFEDSFNIEYHLNLELDIDLNKKKKTNVKYVNIKNEKNKNLTGRSGKRVGRSRGLF